MTATYPTEQGVIAGVPFFSGRCAINDGVNVIVVETPSADEPPQLLLGGRRPLSFRIEAVLAGDAWRSAAEQILEATRDGQTVELQHPTWGSYAVKLTNGIEITQRITRAAGRSDIPLDLTVDPQLPSFLFVSDDPATAIASGVGNITALAQVQAGNVSPSFASTIAAAFSDLSAGVRRADARIRAQIIGVQSISDSISRFEDSINSLANAPGALFAEFSALLRQLYAGITGFTQPADATLDPRTKAATQATQDIFDSSADVVAEPPIETEAQKVKREAATDIVAASQAAAQAQLYEVLAAIAPPDVQAATDTIADVEALAFDLYDLILDGDLYDAHQAVRALVTERLRALTRDLPEIIEYQQPAPSSALLVAFDLYGAQGAVGRDLEIERRNSLTNPARIPETAVLDVVAA